MRQIGTLPSKVQAARLAAYLITEGTSCVAEEEEDGNWSIWVHDEQKLDVARRELSVFIEDPEAEKYRGREAEAERKVRSEQKKRAEAQRNTVDVRTTQWSSPAAPSRPAPFVMTLIVLSVVTTLLTGFADDGRRSSPGSLKANVTSHMAFVTLPDYFPESDPLASVKQGQIWRLITPVFPHLDMMHLVFNMFCLFQFGRLIEWRVGTPKLALFTLLIAVVANTAQAMTPESMQDVMGGPFFLWHVGSGLWAIWLFLAPGPSGSHIGIVDAALFGVCDGGLAAPVHVSRRCRQHGSRGWLAVGHGALSIPITRRCPAAVPPFLRVESSDFANS